MALLSDQDFDSILNNILTDYQNLDSNPDVSEGSMTFVQGSVLASMVWGLYQFNKYNGRQPFPDTADSDNLRKIGGIYDIPYLDTDTDATYLNKILRLLRQAPAGGNKQDFQDWALDQENSFYDDGETVYYNGFATVVDAADGPGTVGVYTIPNDETIIDGSQPAPFPGNAEELLRIATEDYITTVRPLGLKSVAVVSAKPQLENVTMTVTAPEGESLDLPAITQAITDAMNLLAPGETLYVSTLICIALAFGAENASVSAPSGDVTVDNDLFIRPGTILVTEA